MRVLCRCGPWGAGWILGRINIASPERSQEGCTTRIAAERVLGLRLELVDEMIDDLKYFDGSIQEIERVPDDLKALYKCAFEVDAKWLVECASRRQKWLDMGQSLNLYLANPNGPKLHEMYMSAWEKGLKTTYYLRSTAATQVEKSTTDVNHRGIQPRWMKSKSASSDINVSRETRPPAPKQCAIDDPDCEACQ